MWLPEGLGLTKRRIAANSRCSGHLVGEILRLLIRENRGGVFLHNLPRELNEQLG